ncbi:ornithine carbamoyltransferase [Clostridia bacterium]|nr:ornithine carbamoyltransferase [Clostridia bacterium]
MEHLLKMTDLAKNEVLRILNLADQMKFNQKHGLEHEFLKGKSLAMIFSKSSTRTRVSFEVGIAQLGGRGLFLSSSDIQLGRGETIEDTAKVLSRYVDGIMIRTFKQSEVEELAHFSDVPVINALTDDEHPCQILADLMTIREYRSTLEGLNVAWVGDGNNVCNSLIAGAILCDMNIKIAVPEGYDPLDSVVKWAGSKLAVTRDPREAVEHADVVFTDVWTSMGQEQENAKRVKAFAGYQLSAELMKLANPEAMVQHCLPAHRGEEITAEIFAAHAKQIYDEAENRLHAQKAVMTLLMCDEDEFES